MKILMNNRKIGYTYGSISGVYPFRKEKSIPYESPLERDFLILLEFNDSVSDVIGQPLTLQYKNQKGRTVPYSPDFLIYFHAPNAELLIPQRKPLLIEVKPRKKLIKEFSEYKYRFKQAIKYAYDNDMLFKIYDERKIRTQCLSNIVFLKKYQNLVFDLDDQNKILSYLNVAGNHSIEYILEYFCVTREQKGIMLSHIWHLLSNKKILCHYNHPLNTQTQIWINENIEIEEIK